MAEKPFPEKLDDFVFDSILKTRGKILDKYPEDSMIESILRMSYVTMTPQEQIKILENLGPDWIVKIAAKVEKKLAEIDKQGAS
tara:strand:- start:199 stop:450 length:252 start_codon:yes stop_codon:yes gene_type:complete